MKDQSANATARPFFWPLFGLIAAIVLLYLNTALAVFVLAFAAIVWYFSSRLIYGWYILVALTPLTNWFIYADSYRAIVHYLPRLNGVNAPVVEFWAILLLVSFVISKIRAWRRGEAVNFNLPGIHWFALMLASAFLSLANVPRADLFNSLKQIVHWQLFFYFGYIALGANIISNRLEWRRSILVLSGVGVLGALMGLISIPLGVWQGGGFFRAVPFSIGGWAPFGDQHIFLAELATTVLPLILYFWLDSPARTRRIWALCALLVMFAGLLTWSRAGWLTMLFETILLGWLLRRQINWRDFYHRWRAALYPLVPVAAYLVYFLTSSPIVRSSTQARFQFADFSLFLFWRHPFIGNGFGSFVREFAQSKIMVWEYGTAVDAHGIVQKLLAEQGLFGLLAFALFVGWILVNVYRRFSDARFEREARLAAFVSLFLCAAPLFFQLFNTDYYTSKMWVPFALAIAQSLVYGRARSGDIAANLKIKPRYKVITAI